MIMEGQKYRAVKYEDKRTCPDKMSISPLVHRIEKLQERGDVEEKS